MNSKELETIEGVLRWAHGIDWEHPGGEPNPDANGTLGAYRHDRETAAFIADCVRLNASFATWVTGGHKVRVVASEAASPGNFIVTSEADAVRIAENERLRQAFDAGSGYAGSVDGRDDGVAEKILDDLERAIKGET